MPNEKEFKQHTCTETEIFQKFKARSIENISEATLNSVVDLETIVKDFTSNDPMNETSNAVTSGGRNNETYSITSHRGETKSCSSVSCVWIAEVFQA